MTSDGAAVRVGLQQSHLAQHPKKLRHLCKLLSTAASAAVSNYLPDHPHHPSRCISILRLYVRRGELSAAVNILNRIVVRSSIPDSISAVRFTSSLGVPLSGVFKSLVDSNQLIKMEALYSFRNIGALIFDSSIISSMIICFCNLGNLVQTRTQLGKLIKTGSWLLGPAWRVFIRTFCAKDQFFEAYHMFLWMQITGFDLNVSVYRLLVPGLCSVGRLDAAHRVFDVMVKSRIQPTLHLYRSLVYWGCKKNMALEAEQDLREMEGHGLFPDLFMYTRVIQSYCTEGKMESALNLFNRIGKHKGCCKPDASVYSIMVNGFLNRGEIDVAWKLFIEMMERRFVPDRLLCLSIIRSCCRKREVDCAIVSLVMMVNYGLAPDLSCYVTVISALCKENRFEDAERWLNEMLAGGVIPDYASFVSLIVSHLNGKEHVVITKVLQALAIKGFNIDKTGRDAELLFEYILENNVVPINLALNLLIHALCLLKKADLALFFMKKLAAHRFETSVVTCNSLLKCLCEVGNIEDADFALGLFQNLDCFRNELTYSILIDSCFKRGDLDNVLKIFEQMKKRGLMPSLARCTLLIGALCRKKRLGEAEDIFRAMFDFGVKPDVVVYTTLLSGYSNMGWPLDACSLFTEMIRNKIKPSLQAYSTVINVLTKKNMFDKAYYFLNKMLREGFQPDTALYTVLISQFSRKGAIEFAFILYDLMIKNQIKPNLKTIILLNSGVARGMLYKGRPHPFLSEKLREATSNFLQLLHPKFPREKLDQRAISNVKARIDAALHKFQLMNTNTEQNLIAETHYMLLVSCREHKMENACYYANQILIKDVGHEHVTFTILINGYIRSGEIGTAVKLFNIMRREKFQPDLITYNTLVKGLCTAGRQNDKGLCTAGRQNDALLFITMMQKIGFRPDKILYERLMECFCVSYSSDIAFKLFQEMLTHNYVPRHRIYNKLLRILTENNKWWEDCMVFEMLHKHGRKPDQAGMEWLKKLDLTAEPIYKS